MILSRPVALSETAPVADLYLAIASKQGISVDDDDKNISTGHTASEQDQSGSSVADTARERQDHRGTIGDALVNSHVAACWRCSCERSARHESCKSHVYVVLEDTDTVFSVPVYLLVSTPPNDSSPLLAETDVVGSKEIPTCFEPMSPREYALSVTVGIDSRPEVVPIVERLATTEKNSIGRHTDGKISGANS